MDRVELIIALLGDKEAINNLEKVRSLAKELNNKRINLAIEKNQIDRELSNIDAKIKSLTGKKAQILIDTNVKDLDAQIKSIERKIDSLQRKKITSILSSSEIAKIDGQIEKLQARLEQFKQERLVRLDSTDIKNVEAELEALLKRRDELTARSGEIKLESSELQTAERAAKSVVDELAKIPSSAELAARSLSSIGDALSNAGSVISSIGQGIQSLGTIFTNKTVLDTIEQYATTAATDLFSGDVAAATKRFDILNTYTDYLEMVDVSAKSAQSSLDRINEGIQGIPVGLSDVAQQTRLYNMYIDDLEKATDLAVGLNRALVAGGANETQKNGAWQQIDRLLTTGKLDTIRQWRALFVGLGVSTRYLREEMGYASMTTGQFIDALRGGDIAAQDLIDGLADLATSDKLDRAIETYRTTIESGMSNIRFALTRGKANVIDAIDDSLSANTGKNISGWLYTVRDGINALYEAVVKWINANPQALTGAIDMVTRFVDRIKSFDFASLASSIGRALERFLNLVLELYDAMPKDMFEDFIVFSTVWATPVGKGLTLVGNALNALAQPLILLAGVSVSKGITVGAALSQFALKGAAIATGIGLVVSALQGLAMAYKAVRKYEDEKALRIDSLVGTSGVDAAVESYERLKNSMENSAEAYEKSISKIGGDAEGARQAFSEIKKINDELTELNSKPKTAAVRNRISDLMADQELNISRLRDIYPSVNLSINENTGILDANSAAILRNADAVVAASEAQAKADAQYERMKELYKEQIEMEGELAKTRSARAERESRVSGLETMLDAANRLRTPGAEVDNSTLSLIDDAKRTRAAGQRAVEITNALRTVRDEQSALVAQEKEQEEQLKDNRAEISRLRGEWKESNKVLAENRKETKGLLAANDDAAASMDATAQHIDGLIEKYNELAEAVDTSISAQARGFEELEAVAANSLSKSLQTQRANLENLKKEAEYYRKGNALLRGETEFDFSALGENADLFNQELTAALSSQDTASVMMYVDAAESGRLESLREYLGLMKEINALQIDNQRAANDSNFTFDDIIIQDLKNPDAVWSEETQQKIDEYYRGALEKERAFREELAQIRAEDLAKYGAGEGEEADDFGVSAGIRKAEEAMGEYIEVKVPEQGEALRNAYINTFGGDGGEMTNPIVDAFTIGEEEVEAIGKGYEDVSNSITEAGEKAHASIAGEDGSVNSAFAAMQTWIETLTETSIPGLAESIGKFGEDIVAFTDGSVEPLRAKTEETEGKAEDLKLAIERLVQTMADKIGTVSAFTDTIRHLNQTMNAAEQFASRLKDAINSLPDKKTVTVEYNETHTSSVAESSGGLIPQYRARGGSIFGMKPVGTDTVPAMLTPGEFVLQKKAVDKIGPSILYMLNRMDIPSAVDALMRRVPSIPSAHYSVYNNNRSYDNHATVNQTIYTNNPSYSYRRATRFASAL